MKPIIYAVVDSDLEYTLSISNTELVPLQEFKLQYLHSLKLLMLGTEQDRSVSSTADNMHGEVPVAMYYPWISVNEALPYVFLFVC